MVESKPSDSILACHLVLVAAVQYRSLIRHNKYDCKRDVYFFLSNAHILSSRTSFFMLILFSLSLFSPIPSSFGIACRLCYFSLCFISQEYFPQVISFWYFKHYVYDSFLRPSPSHFFFIHSLTHSVMR